MRTGFVYDPIFLEHDTGPGHPECPQRLVASLNYLQQQPWFNQLLQYAARPAERHWLQQVHDGDYIERVQLACRSGWSQLDSPDVSICPRSWDAALYAAGAGLVLADHLLAGDIDNGFALVRPPGHHAETGLALGFCLFNNIAILARYLQQQHRLEKIAIVDWDVHHGNGTQHIFESDPTVLYISLHQAPFYPGTGKASETGKEPAGGTTLNIPMPAGAGDAEYELAFHNQVLPALHRFAADAVLISAGFDAHRDDPLANLRLSSESYAWMTQQLLDVAEQHSSGRLLSVLEGGYNLHAVPIAIAQHLAVLSAYHVTAHYP